MNILKNARAAAIALAYCVVSGCGKGDAPTSPKAVSSTTTVALSAWQSGPSTAQLAWTSATGDALHHIVHIYRDGVLMGSDAESPWTDSTIVGGRDYAYRIALVDATGAEILMSSVITVHTQAPVAAIIPVVTVAPATAAIAIGDSIRVIPTARDSATGVVVDSSTATYTTSDSTVARVTNGGWVYGRATGQVSVKATLGTSSKASTVIVLPVATGASSDTAATSLTLYPSPLSLQLGGSAGIQAVIENNTGAVISGRTVEWTSTNNGVATVSSTGTVTGVSVGTAIVTASSGSVSGTLVVTIVPVPTPPAPPSTPAGPVVPTTPVVVNVGVSPSTAAIEIGATVSLSGAPHDAIGSLLNSIISWTSTNAAVATVSSTGVVTGVSAGTVTILATAGGISGSATITVNAAQPAQPAPPAAVASISISPTSLSLVTGAAGQLSATPRDASGNVLTGNTVVWSSSNVAIAAVTSSGSVAAVSAGTATITATSGGVSGTVTVVVTAPAPLPVATVSIGGGTSVLIGGTVQLTASPRDLLGNLLGSLITWSSNDTSVASVSASGVVTGLGAGTAMITATVAGISADITITVAAPSPAAIATISLSPTSVSVTAGSAAQLSATARDAQGNILAGRVITWTSSNPAIATVSPTGAIVAIAAGTATITAAGEGINASVTVTVNAPAPVSVTIGGGTSVLIGSTLQLSASPRDLLGNLLGNLIAWSSNNTSVASVSASGVVTGVAVGSATITATVAGISANVTITVNAPAPVPVTTISLSPTSVSVVAGSTAQIAATPRDAQGNALVGRTITWASNNTAVASVSATGLITGVAAGSATITVTSGSINANIFVTVTTPAPAAIATISLSSTSVSVTAGSTSLITATARDGQGNALTGRVLTWASNNSAVATVSPTGLITGLTTGTATITATGEGILASLTVTVSPGAVANISISPLGGSLCVAASLQLSVIAHDANGNVVSGRPVVWVSSNPLIASISSTGLALGLTLGTTTLTATVDGVSTSVTLGLCPAVVASVSINGNTGPLSLLTGLLMPLTATAYDANGHVITGRVVTWSVTPSLKALISTLGVLTPLSLGPVTVTATIDGVHVSTTISIIP
jgi:uncharacterized protein YjdB